MPPLSLGLNAPSDTRPADRRNNVWHRKGANRVFVFVHGFSDDSRNCWFNKQANSYWPDRVAAAAEFHDYGIFLGGYPTARDIGDYGIPDCADRLFSSLKIPIDGEAPVLDRAAIVFICHSMGGIVTRYMLESQHHVFRDRTIGLALIASPALGSAWADSIGYIADVIGNQQLRTLATESELLKDLDRRFSALVREGPDKPIPRLFGREACEMEGISGIPIPLIVTAGSAGRYFQPVEKLVGTDHRTCVKPDVDHHSAHEFLRTLVFDFERLFERAIPPRRHVKMVCGRLRRTILIENDDGDALVETGLERIVDVPNGRLTLRPPRLWSGYRIQPELIRDDSGSTDPTVDLETDPSGTTALTFAQQPTPDHPVDATCRYRTENVFSMHQRELRLKTGRTDGEEFAAVRIEIQVEYLVIHVRLTEAMQISGDPYGKVTGLDNDLADPKETERTRALVDYSPLLRTMTWMVHRPVADRSYRLCWRLKAVPERPTQLTAAEQRQHAAFVARLLWLRDMMRKSRPSAGEEAVIEAFRNSIAQCHAFISRMLGATAPGADMELSLMVVDDSSRDSAAKLYMVGGMNNDPESVPLAVGDGNAGRALKKQQTRVFDHARMQAGYRPSPGRNPHLWLVSIPVVANRAVFAVFNIGTFDETHVPSFRQLEPQLPEIGEFVTQLVNQVVESLGVTP